MFIKVNTIPMLGGLPELHGSDLEHGGIRLPDEEGVVVGLEEDPTVEQ